MQVGERARRPSGAMSSFFLSTCLAVLEVASSYQNRPQTTNLVESDTLEPLLRLL